MTNKDHYYQLCERHDIPLHSQAWWMEATAIGKKWDVLLIHDGEDIIGALPYHLFTKFGQKMIVMPAHTQQVFIWVAEGAKKEIVYEKIVQKIDQLCKKERIRFFYQQGYFEESARMFFLKYKFIIRDRHSYRIDNILTEKELFYSFSSNKQRQIVKAKDMSVQEMSMNNFYTFHQHCLSQRHLKIDYSLTFLQSLSEQAIAHKSGQFMVCKNAHEVPLAAIFLVWDQHICYYLLPTYDYDFKNSGAMAWLTMQAILWARENNLSFDFEGSMNPHIALSYQQFGTYETHYYSIEKWYSNTLHFLFKIYQWMQK